MIWPKMILGTCFLTATLAVAQTQQSAPPPRYLGGGEAQRGRQVLGGSGGLASIDHRVLVAPAPAMARPHSGGDTSRTSL